MHYYYQGCHSVDNYRPFSIKLHTLSVLSSAFILIISIQISLPLSLFSRGIQRHKRVLSLCYFILSSLLALDLRSVPRREKNHPDWKLDLPAKSYADIHDHHIEVSLKRNLLMCNEESTYRFSLLF